VKFPSKMLLAMFLIVFVAGMGAGILIRELVW
jgi:hypothetical protein